MRLPSYMMVLGMLAAFIVLFGACEHKELCLDHSHMVDMEIKFDWEAAPDATPQTMVVQFFRADGSHYIRHEFTSAQGGKIRIEAGEYKLLFHNGEMKSVDERGNTYDNYEVTTVSQSLLDPMGRGELSMPPRPAEVVNEPVCGIPENVWGGCHEQLEVLAGVSGQSVTLFPAEATVEYTVKVCNVENMSADLDISGALTGTSESWRLADGTSSGVPVTMPLQLERPDNHTLTARFVSFGHCPQEEGIHYFSIYTSNKNFLDFDVTDQIHEAADPKHVYIEIDEKVTLPDPEEGMNPSISGWDEVIQDIPMN